MKLPIKKEGKKIWRAKVCHRCGGTGVWTKFHGVCYRCNGVGWKGWERIDEAGVKAREKARKRREEKRQAEMEHG